MVDLGPTRLLFESELEPADMYVLSSLWNLSSRAWIKVIQAITVCLMYADLEHRTLSGESGSVC